MFINHAFLTNDKKEKRCSSSFSFISVIETHYIPRYFHKRFSRFTLDYRIRLAWRCNTVKYVSRFHNRAQFASYPKTAGAGENEISTQCCRCLIELWKSFAMVEGRFYARVTWIHDPPVHVNYRNAAVI